MPPPPGLAAPVWIVVLCLVWGSTWYGIRICLADQPPLWSAALRFLFAALAMAVAVPRLRHLDPAPPPPRWLWLTTGTLSFAGSYGILYAAETRVPSGIAAVLWAIFPLLMAGSGVAVLGERLAPRQWLGFLGAFAGIVTVCLGDLGGGTDVHFGWALLVLLSPIVSAVGTTLVKKFGGGCSSLQLNRNGMAFGAGLLLAAAAASEAPQFGQWSLRSWLALLYLALCGTALTFGAYFWLLARTPASRLSLISYVTPILAMLLGAAVGDGTMDARAWLGTALVTTGVALVVQKGARR